jgi:LPXTG-motif cell wall-anchored protein
MRINMIYKILETATLIILVPAGLIGIYIAIDRYQQATLIALGAFILFGGLGWWMWRKRE